VSTVQLNDGRGRVALMNTSTGIAVTRHACYWKITTAKAMTNTGISLMTGFVKNIVDKRLNLFAILS
jgi:hypothetical protein